MSLRFDDSLAKIEGLHAPVANLAKGVAESVARNGYETHAAIIRIIDECLLASFAHCNQPFDIDGELTLVNPEEPEIDKFPNRLPILPPKVKCQVGKHMARNDVSSEWSYSVEPTVTARARVTHWSPERDKRSDVVLRHEIGPPTRYSGLPEIIAENLAMKHRNQTGHYQLHGGSPHPASPPHDYDPRPPAIPAHKRSQIAQSRPFPTPPANLTSGHMRSYMAGLGRFLTGARLEQQLRGEHSYSYALDNPITYVDPSGMWPQPGGGSACASQKNIQSTTGNLDACAKWCASGGEIVLDCHEHGSDIFLRLHLYFQSATTPPPTETEKQLLHYGPRLLLYA